MAQVCLSAMERDFLCDLADLYKPVLGAKNTQDGTRNDMGYVLAYSGVICYLCTTPETDTSTPIGRTKLVNIFTDDKWYFLDTQEVADGWYIQLKTLGDPNYGGWWAMQGNTQIKTRALNGEHGKLMIYAKRGMQPKVVTQ